jgi:hypothetical protein
VRKASPHPHRRRRRLPQEALRASSAEERRRGDEGLQRLQGKLGALAAQVAQGERSLGPAARQQVAELVAEAMQERLADHVRPRPPLAYAVVGGYRRFLADIRGLWRLTTDDRQLSRVFWP